MNDLTKYESAPVEGELMTEEEEAQFKKKKSNYEPGSMPPFSFKPIYEPGSIEEENASREAAWRLRLSGTGSNQQEAFRQNPFAQQDALRQSAFGQQEALRQAHFAAHAEALNRGNFGVQEQTSHFDPEEIKEFEERVALKRKKARAHSITELSIVGGLTIILMLIGALTLGSIYSPEM